MNVDTFPYTRVESIGKLSYIATIFRGANRPVRRVDVFTDNGKEEMRGDLAITVGKSALILTGYSDLKRCRMPMIVTRWVRCQPTEQDEFRNALFGAFDAFENVEEYLDSSNRRIVDGSITRQGPLGA